jgi:hypothetical protein
MVPADAGTMCRGNMAIGTGAEPVAVIGVHDDGSPALARKATDGRKTWGTA